MAAKTGDTVHVHYIGSLEDGSIFDSSEGREPLSFELGSGMVIPGFDEGVTGMNIGDKKKITIPCDQAYGRSREEMVLKVPINEWPDHITPEEGLELMLQGPGGQPLPAKITKVAAAEVWVDANHPLADKTLIFDLELVAVDAKSSIIMPGDIEPAPKIIRPGDM